jgi:UDP-2,3-diacylglucosamine pyrophosphatase LpxH
MPLYFVSDLHIDSPSDPTYNRFIDWIELLKHGDRVVLGGDLFDHWVGVSHYYQMKFEKWIQTVQLKSAMGVEFYFIEGNHDFLIQSLFEKIGIQYFSEKLTLSEGSLQIDFFHGDLANPSDLKYRALRWAFRSNVFKMASQITPGEKFDTFLAGLSSKSRKKNFLHSGRSCPCSSRKNEKNLSKLCRRKNSSWSRLRGDGSLPRPGRDVFQIG